MTKKIIEYIKLLSKGGVIMKVIANTLKCKFCGSTSLVKYGKFRGIQRWWCKACKRKFADNEALPNMKTPSRQIAAALSMYYGGMSLNAIRRHLDQQYGHRPSDSTIYEWISKFTQASINEVKDYKPIRRE